MNLDYQKLLKPQLIELCKQKGIKGYSSKTKAEIIDLLTGNKVNKVTKVIKVNKSPLRYVGGKTQAITILDKYLTNSSQVLLSPFFGGGSFELSLVTKDYQILANDLFAPLILFWEQAQNNRTALLTKIREEMPISKEKFAKMRTVISDYLSSDRETENSLLIATYYYLINRTSFSGMTLSGGFSTQASTGRLNENSLQVLANVNLDKIKFSNLDGVDFINLNYQEDRVMFCDPPYYLENSCLYGKGGDLHQAFDHEKLAKCLLSKKNWILCYNDHEYIRKLYSSCRIYSEAWSYSSNASKKSSEIVILPPI